MQRLNDNSNNKKPIHVCVKLSVAAVGFAVVAAAAVLALKRNEQHNNNNKKTIETHKQHLKQTTEQQRRSKHNDKQQGSSLVPSPSTPSASTPPTTSPLKTIRLGTRTSQLAMYQATLVQSKLTQLQQQQTQAQPKQQQSQGKAQQSPQLYFQVVGLNTQGDIDLIKPLSEFDNKGVFTKELDMALLDHRIDIAVHCMKDLPTQLPNGLIIAAAMERGCTEDAIVVARKHLKQWKNGHAHSQNTDMPIKTFTLNDLPSGAVIGSSALRRQALVKQFYPHLQCKDIRGNVLTRLAKLDRGDYDAVLLARVGLERLQLQDRINGVLEQQQFGYAVGQGSLALVCRQDDYESSAIAAELECLNSRLQCEAERALLLQLQGGCKVPIAVRSNIQQQANNNSTLTLWAKVVSLDGQQHVQLELTSQLKGNKAEQIQAAIELGKSLGKELIQQGAEHILAQCR